MENIIIGGYTIEELKKVQASVKKDAAKHMAVFQEEAEVAMKAILSHVKDSDEGMADKELVNKLAKDADEKLKLVSLISDISGVEYYVPYSEEWGDNSDVWSSLLDDTDLISWRNKDAMYSLYETLESMESESKAWHSSTC